ncbi:MAG TPA: hypothetical protein PLL20_02560 [Phycisphaerae bacterium]|nr:hypothetical protein [Phycisphaerae bacterium]HRR83380.1 hypothetical protein [Phycisphaerae bacterium]
MKNSKSILASVLLFCLGPVLVTGCAGPQRFRKPAPAEDGVSTIPEPVLGFAAGQEDGARQLHVMEWVAKRAWYNLGLPFERADFKGPPEQKVRVNDSWTEITNTVACGGVPLRNQIVYFEIEQRDKPIIIVLRSTDAFGEVMIELDLLKGTARALSITVSRSMIGGQSHSSPMPEESNACLIGEFQFRRLARGWHLLSLEARGARVTLRAAPDIWLGFRVAVPLSSWSNLLEFEDPDPAGGKYGFGSTGTVAVRNISQYELISSAEKARREACLRDMHEFCKGLDAEYEGDVRKANQVEVTPDGVKWTWPPTGATAVVSADRGVPHGVVKAGLYGNDTLIEGAFPEVIVTSEDGEAFRADPDGQVAFQADPLALRMALPLVSGSGRKATAHVTARFTVLTVWWWTVTVEGVEPKQIQAFVGLAPQFAARTKQAASSEAGMAVAIASGMKGGAYYEHNAKAGVLIKSLAPDIDLGSRAGGKGEVALVIKGSKLRFATLWLPAQPLNRIGFTTRMVHYIKYPEGPIQHWRRMPSFQEYPDNVDLARFKANGTEAMVWHHTWISNDFRDREGFLVNHREMKRAMRETHRLGMAAIGYIGIVPGRSSLLRFDDALDDYQKNWDLQDFTFYATPGRWQEFLPWMTDYWCREYGLDGFYADGGLGGATWGRLRPEKGTGPICRDGPEGASQKSGLFPFPPEDADLSLDEIQHRFYYRIKKVLQRHKARFGLEQWGGSHDMLITGFYDCRMIGESFQEAPPEDYRNSYNALLTGTPFKMYGMRETSQNPYNIAMAAVCMSDIQVCSGNGAWGDVADTAETWKRIRPLWRLLESIDFDRLIEARPWYAQELVSGEGFYAGNYTMPNRALVFLANKSETPGPFDVQIKVDHLPKINGQWHVRYVLGRQGALGPLGDGRIKLTLPGLHSGPIGLELIAR